MISIYCGLCECEYNFAGCKEVPQGWLNQHINWHERARKSGDEDIEHLKNHIKEDELKQYKDKMPSGSLKFNKSSLIDKE